MKVFVTGATGWMGRHVVPELTAHGHSVIALVRSPDAAEKFKAQGIESIQGTLTDHAALQEGARAADAVIHLAYIHDFTKVAENARIDLAALDAMAEVMKGTNKTFVCTSGPVGVPKAEGQAATEDDEGNPDPNHPMVGRVNAEHKVLGWKDQGIRSMVVRLSPSTYGKGDVGFMKQLVELARSNGVSYYHGDGKNLWPAGSADDAARLFRIALEKGQAGARYNAAAKNFPFKDIAEVIAKGLGVKAESADQAKLMQEMGFTGFLIARDAPISHDLTTERLGWKPESPDLLQELADPNTTYFRPDGKSVIHG